MRKLAVVTAVVAALSGCATADFQAYEGRNNIHEGQGGTKVVVNGVDFWSNGEPPRKFQVLGMLESQISDGLGADSMMRSQLVTTIKKHGGDAAIQLDSNSRYAGTYTVPGYSSTNVTMAGNYAYANTVTNPGMAFAMNVKAVKFAVIKYLD